MTEDRIEFAICAVEGMREAARVRSMRLVGRRTGNPQRYTIAGQRKELGHGVQSVADSSSRPGELADGNL